MLVYIIDGYNLIHKFPFLRDSDSPHLELINYITKNKLTGSKTNKLIVVFDGYQPSGLRDARAQIIFSGDQTADDVIKKRVAASKNKRQIVVVSDDREVRDAIKREGAISQKIAEFTKTKKKPWKGRSQEKNISYSLRHEITEELRKIWLKEE